MEIILKHFVLKEHIFPRIKVELISVFHSLTVLPASLPLPQYLDLMSVLVEKSTVSITMTGLKNLNEKVR